MSLMDEALEATLAALVDDDGFRPGADASFELELLESVNPNAAYALAERLHAALNVSRESLRRKTAEQQRITALAARHSDWKPSSYVWSSARIEMVAKILNEDPDFFVNIHIRSQFDRRVQLVLSNLGFVRPDQPLDGTLAKVPLALNNIRAQCQLSERNRASNPQNLTLREEIDIVKWILEERSRIVESRGNARRRVEADSETSREDG